MGKTGGGRGTNQYQVKGRSAVASATPAPTASSDVRAAATESCGCGGVLAAGDDGPECVNVSCESSPYQGMDACEDCGAPVEHDADGTTHAAGDGYSDRDELDEDHRAFVPPPFNFTAASMGDAAVASELRSGGDAGMNAVERQLFRQGR